MPNETEIFSCPSDHLLPGGSRSNIITCVANVPRHSAKFSVPLIDCQSEQNLKRIRIDNN